MSTSNNYRYSPTSWNRHYNETNEEYNERMQDQGDLLDSWND